MRAVDMADSPASPPGTVLEVFRAGYLADGRVLRFAEVKVAGGPPPDTGGSDG
jgi:molecular chaperone GrpE (heat shock protein)